MSSEETERTVEGVGGGEVVGVGGDSVPITVVEVEGRRVRCYDVDADIVEKVKQYESELRTRDSLGYLVESYEISSRVLIRLARVEERACFAPRDHWMLVYAHYLATGLRFLIPELLVGLLLDYGIRLTQLVPNAMRGGSRKDKGWYYFTPKVANRESRALFTTGPSSIKGWKEKFFFVDDTEWEKGDTEVEELSSWKAKRTNQNKFSLNEEEEEEVGKLLREGRDLVNILYLTNAECIEAAELYGPSALSEAEMDKFLGAAGGVAIPKKPRKSQRLQPSKWMRDELERRESEEGAEVRAPGKGKGLIPPSSFQSSLFEVKNMMGARRFINSTFPKVDKHHARDKALRYCGALVVKHVLESASWVNGLAQEFMESVKERSLLQRQCDQLQKEKEEMEKKNKEMQEVLDEEKEIRLMKEAYMELKKNVQLLVHNGMEEHISNFISSSLFDHIVNIYRLPIAILAFTDCRKKVKAELPSSVEEEGVEVEEDEVGAGVEGTEVGESQLAPEVEIHPVLFYDEQPPLPDEQQPTQPPFPTEQEPVQSPPPTEI
ncbi:hypothetical protein SLEP1_g53434 [Rubroshorea leprosula]|uniref:Uncharacterized protein n=1 Tax=Rubroshorea leprosula TaxID=152421 RepID=A0AAV5M9C7_9ROSI|nr:hypothetical protein SLEP1_g53434 [Rubroshorea leprosula]